MPRFFPAAMVCAGLLLATSSAQAQLESYRIGSLGFSTFPSVATFAPGDTSGIYIATRFGIVWRMDLATGSTGGTPFLNIANIVGPSLLTAGGNQGLLGLTFHPDFANNGHLYVNYTTNNGNPGDPNGFTRLDRFTYNFNTGAVDPASRHIIFQDQMFSQFHNGGWMGFSPNDGLMYVAVGDGQVGVDPLNLAQDNSSLRGKILRINPDVNEFPADPLRNYGIPADNPLVGQVNARAEIWARGVRNPWQNSFDRVTGDFWVADVGESAREEINFQAAGWSGGANYGWKLREGTIPTPGHGGPRPPDNVDPIYDYDPSLGQSITGGFVYRGPEVLDNGQSLDGSYFFGDFISGRIWTLRYDGVDVTELLDRTAELQNAVNGGTVAFISGFAEDHLGNLYVMNYVTGDIFRIQSSAIPEPASFALAGVGGVAAWMTARRRRWVRAKQADRPEAAAKTKRRRSTRAQTA